jgi:two-component system sensor histidine kinase/response regulator
MEKIGILYIDDNEYNLTAFKASFRKEYKIFIANSAEEGFSILDENKSEIQIIFADYKMPKTSGVNFFESIISQYPDPIRILITGHADIEGVIDAINKGEIYRYIRKPWDEDDIRNTITNAFDIYTTRRQLKLKSEELQKSFEELDRFVYSASHDLRAPLMSILGLVKVAKLDSMDTNTVYMDMIEKSVYKLDIFIKNIIDYHRNKNIEQVYDFVNFDKLIHDTLENFEYYNEKPNIEFRINTDQSEEFKSDIPRLKIIFNNLISNAIKYQKKDKPEQYISIDATVGGGRALIQVEDNGIGIQQEHIESIFQMYFRATNDNAGSGIGLYIVKEAVSKLSGEISVESTIGVGTRFTLNLPNFI